MKALSDSDIDMRDRYEERAASLEYDGGMRRGAAGAQAWKDVYSANPADTTHAPPLVETFARLWRPASAET